MITTEYSVAGPAHITIAIVADLHEFEPKPVLSRLSEIRPDVIAVPGDLFENHEFGENLDKEDDSLISRLLCRIIHITNRLAGLRWRQKHRCSKQNAYDLISRTQNENNPLSKFGKKLHLNIDFLCCLKIYDGNKALFGILGSTNRNEIEKNARRYYGTKGIEKSKTGERYPVLDSIRGNHMVIL